MHYKLSKFKKMKKLLLFLLLTGFGFMAKAQYYPIKFGFKAGATYATLSAYSVEGEETEADYITSFYGGATIEMLFSETFSLQSGLSYVGKGFKGSAEADFFGEPVSFEAEMNLNYLELPLNAILSIPSADGNIFVGGGPYFAYGLSSKSNFVFKMGDEEVSSEDFDVEPVKFGDGLRPTDYGVNLLLGYRMYSGLSISAGYGLGLQSVAEDPDNADRKVKNRHFSLGLGF
ncbi:MAG: PorT family protein, partial [Sphingobacteriales bacterium]